MPYVVKKDGVVLYDGDDMDEAISVIWDNAEMQRYPIEWETGVTVMHQSPKIKRIRLLPTTKKEDD